MKRIENYGERPTGKPDEKVEGRLLKWKDSDYVAFEPVQKRDQDHPARTYLKETKNVSFYKNEGEKENSYSLHVNVDGSTPDAPAAVLQKAAEAQLETLQSNLKAVGEQSGEWPGSLDGAGTT